MCKRSLACLTVPERKEVRKKQTSKIVMGAPKGHKCHWTDAQQPQLVTKAVLD